MKQEVKIKRAYEDASDEDGYRVLVDRLWPRGLSKERLHIDEWNKYIAPSVTLRKWFGHDPARWETFRQKYFLELDHNSAVKDFVVQHRHQKILTLVYGAKDMQHTHALVLQSFLQQSFK